MKDKFIGMLQTVNRPGMDQLLKYLENSDFYKAPASTKYHGAQEGGLLEHSLAVAERFCGIVRADKLLKDTPLDSILICGLLHDICKVNFYTASTRNVKNETTGQWEKIPCYNIEDKFPYGHGEKSVYILNEFIHLQVEEAMAIRWHMGTWEAESYAEKQSLSAAMNKYPLILALQMADQEATYWDGK
jgi:hypothetical protein